MLEARTPPTEGGALMPGCYAYTCQVCGVHLFNSDNPSLDMSIRYCDQHKPDATVSDDGVPTSDLHESAKPVEVIVATPSGNVSCNAYGPFIAPNKAEYWLVHCPQAIQDRGYEFFAFSSWGRPNPSIPIRMRKYDPTMHYSFAMACINLLAEKEKR